MAVTAVTAGVRLCGRLDRMTRLFLLQRKHFAAFAALQFFGSYRTNNGHYRTLVRRGSVAIDPEPPPIGCQFCCDAQQTSSPNVIAFSSPGSLGRMGSSMRRR